MTKKLMILAAALAAAYAAWARAYTAADFGKVVCADGSVYATAADASSAGKTARAMIACVDGNYVLAIALADTSATGLLWNEAVASVGTWAAGKAVAGGQWRLPSADDFKRIFTACQGYDYTDDLWDGMEYSWGNLQTLLSSAGGAQLDSLNSYWLSDEVSESNAYAYRTNLKQFFSLSKSGNWVLARPVLAFGAARTYKKVQLWEGGPYWAETNIGAENPWDYGFYFWWGDTIGYKWENNAWVASDGSSDNFSFEEGNTPTYFKDAATLRSEGWITVDGVLAPEHDAAQAHWGDDWRIPTWQDLINLTNKCDLILTTTNGVNGCIARGRGAYASNSIFFPCAGGGGGTVRAQDGEDGFYWSSAPNPIAASFGSYLGTAVDTFFRHHGMSIRPVQTAEPTIVGSWTSGDCTVTLDPETGTLTVSGPGAMEDYTFTGDLPWFSVLDDIKSIVLEDGVTSIGLIAFHGCGSVTNVAIPDSVTNIAGWSFYCCSNLTSVTLSDSLTSIGQAAFYGAGLTDMTIPASVTNIGDFAFVHCTALTDVYCHPNAADLTWGDATHDFMSDGSTKIHVKASQLAAYRAKFGANVNATFVGDLPEFLSEDFEGGVMPYGWTCESNDSNYLFSVGKGDYSDETGSHGGQYNAKLAHADWGVKSKLISPIVNLSDTTAPTLNFWFINRSWSGDIDELAVYYRTSSEAEWQLMTNFPSAHNSWTECAIALENPTATYQIAFESIYGYGYGIGIDDVSITDAGSLEESVTPDMVITAGEYFKATLAELGYDVPTDGQTAYSVKAYGLPAGLKLMSNKAVTKKDKKGKKVVVTPANVEWWIEGVPTAALDYATNPPYLVITVDGKTETLPLSLGVEAQEVTELEDLALGQSLNEQFYLPGVTNGWTVSGLPTGLKYTAKLVITTKKKGKKIISVTTNALPYSVYGKTTKAGFFTITAKKKVGAYYETLKFRVLVRPAPVDTAIFGDELTNIVTMAYVPVDWDLTGGGRGATALPGDDGHAGRVPLPVVSNVVKVAGLPGSVTFAAANVYKDKNKKQLKQLGQTIVGTPKKPGTYVVTFTKNVTTGTGKKKKTVAKTAQILWVVEPNDVEPELDFNTAGGEIVSGSVGLKYGDLLAFSATSNATVTASGLPSGIKLVKLDDGGRGATALPGGDGRAACPHAAVWGFEGFTTKAGTYLVTVNATLNGKTVTQRVALKVEGLPAWAKGSFNGTVIYSKDIFAGLATMSVTAAGKISGKFQEFGTNWTFSASSYTNYNETESMYSATVTAKYAYKVKEKVKGKWKNVTKSLTREFTFDIAEDRGGGFGGVVLMRDCNDEAYIRINAYQNLWGRSDYKALGKRIFWTSKKKPYKEFSDFVDVEGTSCPISLKITSSGVVTATLTFDTGKTKKNKKTKKVEPVYYKPSCTTVVIQQTAADANPFTGGAYLYFAPSAGNNFPGYADHVTVQP